MKRDKEIDELANFIVNRMNFGQAIAILIEKSRKTAEYMLNNGCKKEDFHLYLDKANEKNKLILEPPKKESFWSRWINKLKPNPSNKKKKAPQKKQGNIRRGFKTTK